MTRMTWRIQWIFAIFLLCLAAVAMVGCTRGNEDFRDVTVKWIPASVDNEENADTDRK